MPGGRMSRILDLLGGDFALAIGLEQPSRQAFEDCDRDVLVDRLVAEQHGTAAFRDIGDARGLGGGRVRQRLELAVDFERAAVGAKLPEQGARELQLPAAHEAVDAQHLAGAGLKGHVAIGGEKRQGGGAKGDRRLGAAREPDLAEIAFLQLLAARADHALDDPALVDGRSDVGRRDLAAVAKDGDRVRNLQDVVEEMRDEDDASAALAQLGENAEQALDLGRRQRGCRLVENDDARAREQDARELDKLLNADRKIAEARARVDVEPEIFQLHGGGLGHPPPGDDAEAVDRLSAEKDIFGDAQFRRDAELLMHHPDAGRERVARRAEMDVSCRRRACVRRRRSGRRR